MIKSIFIMSNKQKRNNKKCEVRTRWLLMFLVIFLWEIFFPTNRFCLLIQVCVNETILATVN
jgi:hypothetical protein